MTVGFDSRLLPDGGPAGTDCALCGADISPIQYPNCRAVLVDESYPDEDREMVRMVCEDCWVELEHELSESSGTESTRSA